MANAAHTPLFIVKKPLAGLAVMRTLDHNATGSNNLSYIRFRRNVESEIYR